MKLLNIPADELAEKLHAYFKDLRYKVVFDYTKKRFESAEDLSAHNWAHAYRDTLNAIVIGEAEEANMAIVLPAITMHDIGFLYGAVGDNHGEVGAEKVESFLKEAGAHYHDEQIAAIAACIRTHKGSWHNIVPESLEAKVVADADMLEKFGPFGVYQTVRTYTEFNWSIDKILERRDSIAKVQLETETGKKLAAPGKKFVTDFYKELAEANEPYQS